MNSAPEIIETPNTSLQIDTIYLEPAVQNYARGQQILARFPNAKQIEVLSHWNIPGLHGNEGNAPDWIHIKRTHLVLGVKKGMTFLPYQRSCDWVIPSITNGCALACAYCYVPRRKGFANPISTFVNIEQISQSIVRHVNKQGRKFEATSADDESWMYEIGCNSDASVDALISDNVRDLVSLFRTMPGAKATFATKWVNRALLDFDPQRQTRIRFSLMPTKMSKLVDIRTSPIQTRIDAINDFYAAGYEVNINFAPVILHDGWLQEWEELFAQLADELSSDVKAQLACEIIFLTHNAQLHEVNLQWHPRAEDVLWTPENQESKISEGGGANVRYKSGFKGARVREFRELLSRYLPDCRVRYAF